MNVWYAGQKAWKNYNKAPLKSEKEAILYVKSFVQGVDEEASQWLTDNFAAVKNDF